MKAKWLMATFLGLIAATWAPADSIDNAVRAQMKEMTLPGVALAVIRNGVILKAQGYGYSDVAKKQDTGPSIRYVLASLSKQFTSTCVMQLVEQGKIDLSVTVRTYIPDAPMTWQGITMANLLSHTAGFPHDVSPYPLASTQLSDPDVWLKTSYKVKLQSAPGAKYAYSNAGYEVAGMIVERVSKMSLYEYQKANILQPSGMSLSTMVGASPTFTDMAEGYKWSGGKNVLMPIAQKVPIAAGGVISTANDLAAYDTALWENKLVSAKSYALMTTPFTLNNGKNHGYGFGWAIRQIGGGRVVFHNGGFANWNTAMYRYIDQGVTVIVLINRGAAGSSSADALARTIGPLVDPDIKWPPRKGKLTDTDGPPPD